MGKSSVVNGFITPGWIGHAAGNLAVYMIFALNLT